jgi:hypothetical protein
MYMSVGVMKDYKLKLRKLRDSYGTIRLLLIIDKSRAKDKTYI